MQDIRSEEQDTRSPDMASFFTQQVNGWNSEVIGASEQLERMKTAYNTQFFGAGVDLPEGDSLEEHFRKAFARYCVQVAPSLTSSPIVHPLLSKLYCLLLAHQAAMMLRAMQVLRNLFDPSIEQRIVAQFGVSPAAATVLILQARGTMLAGLGAHDVAVESLRHAMTNLLSYRGALPELHAMLSKPDTQQRLRAILLSIDAAKFFEQQVNGWNPEFTDVHEQLERMQTAFNEEFPSAGVDLPEGDSLEEHFRKAFTTYCAQDHRQDTVAGNGEVSLWAKIQCLSEAHQAAMMLRAMQVLRNLFDPSIEQRIVVQCGVSPAAATVLILQARGTMLAGLGAHDVAVESLRHAMTNFLSYRGALPELHAMLSKPDTQQRLRAILLSTGAADSNVDRGPEQGHHLRGYGI